MLEGGGGHTKLQCIFYTDLKAAEGISALQTSLLSTFDKMRTRVYGNHFACFILRCIFADENLRVLIQIKLIVRIQNNRNVRAIQLTVLGRIVDKALPKPVREMFTGAEMRHPASTWSCYVLLNVCQNVVITILLYINWCMAVKTFFGIQSSNRIHLICSTHKCGRRKLSLRFCGPRSKLGFYSWSNSLIFGMYAIASAQRYFLVSSSCK